MEYWEKVVLQLEKTWTLTLPRMWSHPSPLIRDFISIWIICGFYVVEAAISQTRKTVERALRWVDQGWTEKDFREEEMLQCNPYRGIVRVPYGQLSSVRLELPHGDPPQSGFEPRLSLSRFDQRPQSF